MSQIISVLQMKKHSFPKDIYVIHKSTIIKLVNILISEKYYSQSITQNMKIHNLESENSCHLVLRSLFVYFIGSFPPCHFKIFSNFGTPFIQGQVFLSDFFHFLFFFSSFPISFLFVIFGQLSENFLSYFVLNFLFLLFY